MLQISRPLSEGRVTRLLLMVTNGELFPFFKALQCLSISVARWISGAGDPRTKIHLVMGKSDPGNKSNYNQQSVVLVPADTPGVKVVRPMHVFGYDEAPEGHCEIIYENVRVPLQNLVLGWGRGFEVCEMLNRPSITAH
jgi:alkylation response protein AidB-like acyl-CoA dehydrogenase